jgi:hypothetical protein
LRENESAVFTLSEVKAVPAAVDELLGLQRALEPGAKALFEKDLALGKDADAGLRMRIERR